MSNQLCKYLKGKNVKSDGDELCDLTNNLNEIQ